MPTAAERAAAALAARDLEAARAESLSSSAESVAVGGREGWEASIAAVAAATGQLNTELYTI